MLQREPLLVNHWEGIPEAAERPESRARPNTAGDYIFVVSSGGDPAQGGALRTEEAVLLNNGAKTRDTDPRPLSHGLRTHAPLGVLSGRFLRENSCYF